MKKKKFQKIETIAAHTGLKPEENHGIVNPPVYHASTILSPSMKNYKDRSEKKCEYAVLVSMLETDNEFYNKGIVDMSHRFPKMYVIRPQFFLPIISLLRNASMESLKYKSQIDLMKRENYDITNFETTLEQFKNAVGKNVSLAQDRFNDAISEIEKSISHLQKTKEALILSKKHLLSADSKSQDLTVKKLTRNNPTMKKKFNDLNNFEDEVA